MSLRTDPADLALHAEAYGEDGASPCLVGRGLFNALLHDARFAHRLAADNIALAEANAEMARELMRIEAENEKLRSSARTPQERSHGA